MGESESGRESKSGRERELERVGVREWEMKRVVEGEW